MMKKKFCFALWRPAEWRAAYADAVSGQIGVT